MPSDFKDRAIGHRELQTATRTISSPPGLALQPGERGLDRARRRIRHILAKRDARRFQFGNRLRDPRLIDIGSVEERRDLQFDLLGLHRLTAPSRDRVASLISPVPPSAAATPQGRVPALVPGAGVPMGSTLKLSTSVSAETRIVAELDRDPIECAAFMASFSERL